MHVFFAALSFMTRIPVALRFQGEDPDTFRRAPNGFVFAGLLLGAIMAAASSIFYTCFPVLIAAVVLFGLSLLLTGGLHEDGAADVADATGAWKREQRFEIMRDSHIGAYGVLALIFFAAVRIACFASLMEEALEWLPFILIVVFGWSRWTAFALMARLPYLKNRPGGAGVASGMTRPGATLVLVQAGLLAGLSYGLLSFPGLLLSAGAMLALLLCGRYFYKQYEGVTGDCLGASIVLSESVLLLVAVALLP